MIGRFIEFLTSGGVTFIDIIDVLIVTTLIYALLNLVKGTRAVQIISGLTVFLAIFFLSDILELRTLNWLLRYFFASAGLILIIIFQPEIRSFFSNITRNPIFRFFSKQSNIMETIDDLIYAVNTMAEKRIGGIVVLERKVGLRNYIEAGIRVDANLSYDLLLTIFNPHSPMHDGAIIVRGDRIIAASCYLPLTVNPRLSRELGTRHRAAIGISEETDAIVIIVSEERGEISVAQHGSITKPLIAKNLQKILTLQDDPEENVEEVIKRYKRSFKKAGR
ncbi:MAG: diadenylate cyclase CdaA [Acidobacteria bacterium]|nr:diadenylate cyclase CdaA [Acidobacteriota bacterium]